MIRVFICEAMDGTGDTLYFLRREDLMHYVFEHAQGDVKTSSALYTEEAIEAFCEAARCNVTLH